LHGSYPDCPSQNPQMFAFRIGNNSPQIHPQKSPRRTFEKPIKSDTQITTHTLSWFSASFKAGNAHASFHFQEADWPFRLGSGRENVPVHAGGERSDIKTFGVRVALKCDAL
jgi:hypothetical protein